MKKLSYALLTSIAGITAVQAEKPFNSSYLGIQLGYTQRVTTTDIEASDPVNSGDLHHKKRSHGGQYGLYAGYGRVNPSNLYMGLEATIHNDSLNKARHTHDIALGGNNYQVKTRHYRGVVFGLAPRIGMVSGTDALIYGKVNVQFSKDWVTHEINGHKVKSPTFNQVCLVPAIGYEHANGKNLMRIEYGYNLGSSLNAYKSHAGIPNGKLLHTGKYHAHEVKVGYAYQF